jgi:YegS/Rv2252/BmrU family lipid kinase
MQENVSADQRRVVVIRNPAARRPPGDADLLEPFATLKRAGWDVTVRDTRGPGDGAVLAADAAAAGASVVVACGGDGTLNEVLSGVAETETALAVLPAGTANVWAHEIGVGNDVGDALGLVEGGRRVRIDTGMVQLGDEQPRRFLLMCSLGLDAVVVWEMEGRSSLKRRFGRAAFAWPAIRALVGTRAVHTTITVDGIERRGPLTMAVVGNTRLYGGITKITDGAILDDGLLDLVTFSGQPAATAERRVIQRLIQLSWVASGSLSRQRHESVHYLRSASFELRPEGPLPVQVDGEFVGQAGPEASLRLWAHPRSVTVVVPAGHNPLFSA